MCPLNHTVVATDRNSRCESWHGACRLVADEERDAADLWVVNSCTVKNPSQAAMGSLLARGRALGKALVGTGCVPQGSRSAPELAGLSLLGALPAATFFAGSVQAERLWRPAAYF